MAIQIQKTISITADDFLYEVEKMSQPIKDMVAMLDEFRQQEMDAHVLLTMARGAIRDVQSQLLLAIRKEREEVEQRAAALGITNTTEPTGDE